MIWNKQRNFRLSSILLNTLSQSVFKYNRVFVSTSMTILTVCGNMISKTLILDKLVLIKLESRVLFSVQ